MKKSASVIRTESMGSDVRWRHKFTTEMNVAAPYLLFEEDDPPPVELHARHGMSSKLALAEFTKAMNIFNQSEEKPHLTTTTTTNTLNVVDNLVVTSSVPTTPEKEGISMVDLGEFDAYLENIDPKIHANTRWGGDPLQNAPIKCPNLLSLIERQVEGVSDKKRLRQLIVEATPRQSKWYDPNRMGQAELYEALEKVIFQLKGFAPHSIPFLQKVNRKEVPDYYDIIKQPMDLGSMYKKLKTFAYHNKQQFMDDLALIYENCFTYNADPESPLRKSVTYLKDRWTTLMMGVPDITIQSKDDIDSLILSHLDRLSEEGSLSGSDSPRVGTSHSPGHSRLSSRNASFASSQSPLKRSHTIGPSSLDPLREENIPSMDVDNAERHMPHISFALPERSTKGMMIYREEASKKRFPEIHFFHQTIPDSVSISKSVTYDSVCLDPFYLEYGERLRDFRSLVNDAPPLNTAAALIPSTLDMSLSPQCIGPLMERRLLSIQLALLLYTEVTCERIQMPVISILTDVLSTIMKKLLKKLKALLESSEEDAALLLILRNFLREHGSLTTKELLTKVQTDHTQLWRKLDRAMAIVTEHQSAMHVSVEDASDGGKASREGSSSMVAEDDLDLELLGATDAPTAYPTAILPHVHGINGISNMVDSELETDELPSPPSQSPIYDDQSVDRTLSDLLGITPNQSPFLKVVKTYPSINIVKSGGGKRGQPTYGQSSSDGDGDGDVDSGLDGSDSDADAMGLSRVDEESEDITTSQGHRPKRSKTEDYL